MDRARPSAAVFGVTTALFLSWGACSAHDQIGGAPTPRGTVSAVAVAAGQGAATTTTGVGGSGGSAESPPPDCACVIKKLTSDPTCNNCINMASNAPGTCTSQLSDCQSDAGCSAILTCLTTMACTSGACINQCLGPASTSTNIWGEYESCVCGGCVNECDTNATCP